MHQMLVQHDTRIRDLRMGDRDALDSISHRFRRIHDKEERLEQGRAYEDIRTLLRIIGGEYAVTARECP